VLVSRDIAGPIHCSHETVVSAVTQARSQEGSQWSDYPPSVLKGWFRGSVVERRSLTGELSLSCARPVADG